MKSFYLLLLAGAVFAHSPLPAAAKDDINVFAQTAHGAAIECLALTSDGDIAVSGDANAVLKTWQTKSGKLMRTIPSPAEVDGIDGFVFSPSETLLFGETHYQEEETIGFVPHIYDVKNGRELEFETSDDEYGPYGYPIFSKDDQFVYMTTLDDLAFQRAQLYRRQDNRFEHAKDAPADVTAEIKKTLRAVQNIRAPGDRYVYASYTKQQFERRKFLLSLSKNQGLCNSGFADKRVTLKLTRQDRTVSVGGDDIGLLIDTSSQHFNTSQRSALSGSVYSDVTPDLHFIISGHPDGSIRAWDLTEGKQLFEKVVSDRPLTDLKLIKTPYTQRGELSVYSLHASAQGSVVYRSDLKTGHSEKLWITGKDEFTSIQTTLDGSLILLQNYDHGLVIDIAGKQETTIIPTISPDSAAGSMTGLLRLKETGRTVFYGGVPYDLTPGLKKITTVAAKGPAALKNGRDVYGYLASRQTEKDTIYLESLGLRATSFGYQEECCNGGLFIVKTSDYSIVAAGAQLLGSEDLSGGVSFPKPSDQLNIEGKLGLIGKDILLVADGTDVSFIDLSSMKNLGAQTLHPDSIESISRIEGSDRLVTAGRDGTISLWQWNNDKKRLDPLLNLYALPKGQWLTMTADGFFAGSDKAGEFINVQSKSAVYSVDQFYEALARSDLVKALLAGDPLRDYLKAATALNLGKILASGTPPELRLVRQEIADDKRSAKITVSVRDTGGGVGQMLWRDNGVAQGVESRGVQPLTGEFEVTQAIDLVPGANEISVVAYNGSGLIKSTPLTVTIAGGSAIAGNGRLFILAAGVNDYDYKSFKLDRARDDATTIAQKIAESAKGLFSDVRTKLLLDHDVTKDGLSAAFTELAREIRPEDKFVFFLAGHGKTIDGQYFFIGQDFNPDKGRNFDTATIRQDQWQKWFVTIKARASLLIYDTCEAGTNTRALEGQTQAFDKLRDATGRSILSATSDEGAAIDSYGGHGLFTYALLRSLSDGDLDHNNEIDISEMSLFATATVPEISKANAGIIQLPWSRIEADFPIGMKLAASVAQGEGDENDAAPATVNAFLTADSPVYRQSTGGAEISGQLKAHDGVHAFEGTGDYVKVARGGKVLGYVRRDVLQQLN